MKRNYTRQMAIFLCIVLITSMFTGFTNYKGFGIAYYESSVDIFDGVSYTEIIGEHSINGIEHGYIVEAETSKNGVFPLVYNGQVRSVSTVASMIKTVQEQGYKVLAAINGDVYDTSSGTPKGLVIHDWNIITSGYNADRVIAFDSENNATLEKVDLTYSAEAFIEYQKENNIMVEVDVPVEIVKTVTSEAINENGEIYVIEEQQKEIVYQKQMQQQKSSETVTEPVELKIDFVNVPHGEALGLHLYNSNYANSTMSKGVYAEAVVEVDNVQLRVNDTIKGTVKHVNNSTENTAITDKTLVLSTALGSKNYNYISSLKVGSEIEISVTDNLKNGLSNAKECIGYYYSLIEKGKNVTNGTNINPRSSIGIKKDGTLVLAEIDGRQASHSRGLHLPDLAEFMSDFGCEYAFNLDGGGSSVLYVRQPGLDRDASRVSLPSAGSERKVANAILLVYKENASSSIENIHTYPNNVLMMPGSSKSFTSYFSNKLYEKQTVNAAVTYGTDSKYGIIDSEGLFTAGDKVGETYVEAKYGRNSAKATVRIVEDIIIIPEVTQILCEANEVREISVAAGYGTEKVSVPVISSPELFTWSCDKNIGSIDENGVFTASIGLAQEGKIYISYNGKTEEITVNVGAGLVTFDDTVDHWAQEPIGILASIGYLNGMGDNLFMPEGQLTRGQFITMLYNITEDISKDSNNPTLNSTTQMNFTDVLQDEWYYNYIKWGFENSIVNGMGDGTFAPNAPITREQMAVMLCNYAAYIGFMLPQSAEIPVFIDSELISGWAKDYVFTVAGSGIINGFETGEFMPQGIATRAQAAKVIYGFCEIRGIV